MSGPHKVGDGAYIVTWHYVEQVVRQLKYRDEPEPKPCVICSCRWEGDPEDFDRHKAEAVGAEIEALGFW